jgi:hypothetical protein
MAILKPEKSGIDWRMGKASCEKERTECLVVLPHKGERIEVDVTVEVHLGPA